MLNELEAAVLDKLLAGDLPALACLRTQRQRMHVTKRDYSGVGFFTEFGHPDDVVRLATSKPSGLVTCLRNSTDWSTGQGSCYSSTTA
jgi:hypothetical protein